MIFILLAIIILIVLWSQMIKRGSKKTNDAFNTFSAISVEKAKRKAAGITKEYLKGVKKQNIERRKAGLPELDWDGVPFEDKMRK